MIGTTISHYRIIEKIGEGGMGVVYKAHDTKLDRDVALKFLPATIHPSAEELKRFEQEAKAISALNHANIATIYDVDEYEGLAYAGARAGKQRYLVLEYIPGGTLKAKLKQLKSDDKEFSISEVVEYGIQMSKALAHAHQHGIIHRDVKTDNMMLMEDGTAKLTDFGLAKLRGNIKLTKTGSTVGTAAYMSPEQVRGEETDARSDIFSLGIVLYELVTSHLPFRGEFETALSYSILNENPIPVRSLRKDSPEALEKVIDCCLEKEKIKRYQSAEEVVNALREVQQQILPAFKVQKKTRTFALIAAGGIIVVAMIALAYFFWLSKQPRIVSAQAGQDKSIVVLPFGDISPNKDNEYFSDGLTDEIITELSRINGLDVRSQHASIAFKGTKKNIKDIAEEVNVRYVLEGSVRKEGDDLRIAAKLIDARDDRNIWADTYPGTLKDVFDMQEKVSRSIVNALSVQLSPEESKKISERPIDNVQAYDSYLKARREILQWNEESFDRAKKDLNDGLDIAGPNAALYGTMAYLHWNYANFGIKRDENLAKAEEYVQKAFELDPQSSQAHLALGLIYANLRNDPKKSIFHLKAALESNPHDYDALLWLTTDYAFVGKMSLARACLTDLVKIDPVGTGGIGMHGILAFYEGRFDSAVSPVSSAYHAEPDNMWNQLFYPIVLVYNGRTTEAKSVLERYTKTEPKDPLHKIMLFLRYALDDNQEGMRQLMTPGWKEYLRADPQWSQFVSQIYAMTGLKKEALDWLENAIDRGFINYPLIAEHDPFFRKFKDDERFQKIVQRMKTEWENFKD
ncbi:MAG: protein kinase [Bacteroidota bacterium]|jgi:non-specific serine/threonine protein kinase